MRNDIILFVKQNKKRILVKDLLKNNHTEIYNEFINWSHSNNIECISISELVYVYINKLTEKPKCKTCNNYTKFIKLSKGYRDFCCMKCQANNIDIITKRENTCIEKYGVQNPLKSKELQNKIQTVIKDKYGVDNISQLDSVKRKKEATTTNNFGVSHHSKLLHNKETYSKNIKNNKSKLASGVEEKYGVDNVSKVEHIQNKKINTFKNKSLDRLKNKYVDYTVCKFNNAFDIIFKSETCGHEFNIQEQLFDLRLKNEHAV